MKTQAEYITRLEILKDLEEEHLKMLSAIKMKKCLTWIEMNHQLGNKLKAKKEILDTEASDIIEETILGELALRKEDKENNEAAKQRVISGSP